MVRVAEAIEVKVGWTVEVCVKVGKLVGGSVKVGELVGTCVELGDGRLNGVCVEPEEGGIYGWPPHARITTSVTNVKNNKPFVFILTFTQ